MGREVLRGDGAISCQACFHCRSLWWGVSMHIGTYTRVVVIIITELIIRGLTYSFPSKDEGRGALLGGPRLAMVRVAEVAEVSCEGEDGLRLLHAALLGVNALQLQQ